MSFNSHPPLRRTVSKITNILQPPFSSTIITDGNLFTNKSTQMHTSASMKFSINSFEYINDSCNASTSEESQHSSLSRESSDPLSEKFNSLTISTTSDYYELLQFTTKLGYDQTQLDQVLENLNPLEVTEDKVLSELIKLGKIPALEYNKNLPSIPKNSEKELRSIVIDGSNIAMTYGNKAVFACKGIRICIDYFLNRGHTEIICFIPSFRREQSRPDSPISDQQILFDLESEGHLFWTPSRRINGRRIVCHDDRYILNAALDKEAIIVSNDEYRDLIKENPQYKRIVQNNLLMYSFVHSKFMPPDDPLGKHGPTLDQFLSKNYTPLNGQICPYSKKCTYGNKCKYYHPEKQNENRTSVVDKLLNDSQKQNSRGSGTESTSMGYNKCHLKAIQRTLVTRASSLNPNFIPNNNDNKSHINVSRQLSTPLHWNNQSPQISSHKSNTSLYSTTNSIWSPIEINSGFTSHNPIFQNDIFMGNEERQRLQYHLSQLFPPNAVTAVLLANPLENNPQTLCKMILAYQSCLDSSFF
ncbi:Zinc finger, CCCH-type domain and Ribonuclease Zc3h12a-like domain-containing protein [Strongyloides ratti]|uniref:Zinc finger, CCCH-type domain and Ribonuclease Zc3h12a-like domain-containing protein n=1 Tax=Strongyloides ratti TaxID=34506 RepID=A0A090L2C6_STRRB|nr:Zinc finger, CCCH-type domain and Ribonuclease Zc3h12a-like domain-containing protein [Strongyloides ratti]CEF63842.1 Zinc finger, CCCH-type domain and Ribonuclease Zc3h12a-like domain-containing protein [Strongyloides ratti]